HTPEPPEIAVHNLAGMVTLTCLDTTETEVVVAALQPEHAETATQTTVVSSTRAARCASRYRRSAGSASQRSPSGSPAPAGARLHTRTASAEVKCTGTLSGLTVAGASSVVFAELVNGDCACTLASGDVRLGAVSGRVRAHRLRRRDGGRSRLGGGGHRERRAD